MGESRAIIFCQRRSNIDENFPDAISLAKFTDIRRMMVGVARLMLGLWKQSSKVDIEIQDGSESFKS